MAGPATLAAATAGPVVTTGWLDPGAGPTATALAWTGPASTSTCPRASDGIGDEHDDGSRGHVVGMGAGERQRRVGEASGEGDGVVRIRGELRQVGGLSRTR